MEQKISQLATLLPQLRSGDISAIEFGHSNDPMGFMSHHRIMMVETLSGPQFAIKEVARGMLGSGVYLGNCDDQKIIQECGTRLERYLRPSANPAVRAFMEARGKDRKASEYFAILNSSAVAA